MSFPMFYTIITVLSWITSASKSKCLSNGFFLHWKVSNTLESIGKYHRIIDTQYSWLLFCSNFELSLEFTIKLNLFDFTYNITNIWITLERISLNLAKLVNLFTKSVNLFAKLVNLFQKSVNLFSVFIKS